jgi:Protein of unknown function (DUF3618)
VNDVRDPDTIRREIAETREELGAAVEELAAKTDVKARAREKLDALTQSARAHPLPLVAFAASVVVLVVVVRSR